MNNDKRIEWLSKQYEVLISRGDDDGTNDDFVVTLIEGSRNDREYNEVGSGETFEEALDAAIEYVAIRDAERLRNRIKSQTFTLDGLTLRSIINELKSHNSEYDHLTDRGLIEDLEKIYYTQNSMP